MLYTQYGIFYNTPAPIQNVHNCNHWNVCITVEICLNKKIMSHKLWLSTIKWNINEHSYQKIRHWTNSALKSAHESAWLARIRLQQPSRGGNLSSRSDGDGPVTKIGLYIVTILSRRFSKTESRLIWKIEFKSHDAKETTPFKSHSDGCIILTWLRLKWQLSHDSIL